MNGFKTGRWHCYSRKIFVRGLRIYILERFENFVLLRFLFGIRNVCFVVLLGRVLVFLMRRIFCLEENVCFVVLLGRVLVFLAPLSRIFCLEENVCFIWKRIYRAISGKPGSCFTFYHLNIPKWISTFFILFCSAKKRFRPNKETDS